METNDDRIKESLNVIYKSRRKPQSLAGLLPSCHGISSATCQKEGVKDCGDKLGLLSAMVHEKATSREMRDSLDFLIKAENLEKLGEKDRNVCQKAFTPT